MKTWNTSTPRIHRFLPIKICILLILACICYFLDQKTNWPSGKLDFPTEVAHVSPLPITNASTSLDNPFPGKCILPNYEQIKKIPIIYSWVNGSLECFGKTREKRGGAPAKKGANSRDREIGELMYSIRSYEKFFNWHEGPIFIVSPGHIPHWLDLNNPRIQVVNQDDLVPEYAKKFLPTFNTNVLEQFYYRMPGITDYYLHFNDDYLFTNEVTPHEFFTCDGGIKILQEKGSIKHGGPGLKKSTWISSILSTQAEMDLRWGQEDRKFLKHAPYLYSKRVFQRVHQIFDRQLYQTLSHPFRHGSNMITPLLHHYYLVAQGTKELGIPVEQPSAETLSRFILLVMKDNNVEKCKERFETVLSGKHDWLMLTINDGYSKPEVGDRARAFLSTFLPEPSSFELPRDAPRAPVSAVNATTCTYDPKILPPLTTDICETSATSVNHNTRPWVITEYREIRATVFLNSVLRGVGFGFGLSIAFLVYQIIVYARKNLKQLP